MLFRNITEGAVPNMKLIRNSGRRGLMLAAAAVSFTSTVLFAQGPGGPGGPGGAPVKITVPVGRVAEKEDVETNSYTGIVLSPQTVKVVTRITGELLEIGFKDGDRIRKGQLLYRFDDIKYRAAVKNAEAQIAQCKAKVDYAQKSFDRNNSLYDSKAVSLDTVENTQSSLNAQQASLAAAEAELVSAQEDLKYCSIHAPIDGVVATTNYTVGNYLTPNSGTLVTLFQVDPVRVRFAVSTRDYLNLFGSFEQLKKEGRVTVILSNGAVYPHEGTIELLNMEANRNTDTVQVYALFGNPDRHLLPNSTVSVNLAKRSSRKLPSVPSSAIMHDSQGAYVWVLEKGDKVKKRSVELGNTDGMTQMILGGLKNGEEIVTDGTHKVMDGSEIEPDRKEK